MEIKSKLSSFLWHTYRFLEHLFHDTVFLIHTIRIAFYHWGIDVSLGVRLRSALVNEEWWREISIQIWDVISLLETCINSGKVHAWNIQDLSSFSAGGQGKKGTKTRVNFRSTQETEQQVKTRLALNSKVSSEQTFLSLCLQCLWYFISIFHSNPSKTEEKSVRSKGGVWKKTVKQVAGILMIASFILWVSHTTSLSPAQSISHTNSHIC